MVQENDLTEVTVRDWCQGIKDEEDWWSALKEPDYHVMLDEERVLAHSQGSGESLTKPRVTYQAHPSHLKMPRRTTAAAPNWGQAEQSG